jgi:hypothetical protein
VHGAGPVNQVRGGVGLTIIHKFHGVPPCSLLV